MSTPDYGWMTENVSDDLTATVDGVRYVRYDVYLSAIRQRNETRAEFIRSVKGGVLGLRLDEARNEVARLSKIIEGTPREFATLRRQLEEQQSIAEGWKNRFENCWARLDAAEAKLAELRNVRIIPG